MTNAYDLSPSLVIRKVTGAGPPIPVTPARHYDCAPIRNRRPEIATTIPAATAWTTRDSEKLYNLRGWGLGYFRINQQGHVTVHPSGDATEGLDLYQLALDLNDQGVQLPVLLRFSDILKSRIEMLAREFQNAIDEFGYEGSYTTVYPIKVNQQRHVVEEILEFGSPHGVGLECGSKGELQAVLGLSEQADHLVVCNGYKDEEFHRLALMGEKLGHTVVIVLEQLHELDTLLQAADEMNIRPTVGVRIKLSSEGAGRWAKSAGEKSKFGLNSVELMKLLTRLEQMGRKDVLKLVHFHLGSQITDIRFIKSALEEITRYYAELRQMGFDIKWVDVGGGLGVDYDGSRSSRSASMNYSVREYASDIVYTIGNACREAELPMPDLISESGRALTAHHSLLLINVIDVESPVEPIPPVVPEDAHQLLRDMAAELRDISLDRVREIVHDATFAKQRAQEMFISGVLSLQERADAELLYLCLMNGVANLIADDRASYPEITSELEAILVDRFFCNFSLFQSLPDNWAIDQLFPVMPIHRLDEAPSRRGTLHDVTCDSDGVIDRFSGGRKGKSSLELHPFEKGRPYILGIFLTGAYQEILGDLHNLFGDTNAVHIQLTERGYEITDLVHGDTVTEVLNYVQFGASDLLATFRRKVNNARLTRQEANSFIADYVAGLEGYTYLEGDLPRNSE